MQGILFRNIIYKRCKNVETKPSSTVFNLGNGLQAKSQKPMKIPLMVGSRKINIVDCEIPLLLSKDAMKNT